MRIISGSAKGRKLASLRGKSIRPTSDKIRQAIFNILNYDWSQIAVLDLFAGTGALGIEALSRGASAAVLVDDDYSAVEIIRKNLTTCGFPEERVIRKNPLQGLAFLERLGISFNLVFIDPPYGLGLAQKALDLLARSNIVEIGGLIVVESDKLDVISMPVEFELEDLRSYGRTRIAFFRKMEKISREGKDNCEHKRR